MSMTKVLAVLLTVSLAGATLAAEKMTLPEARAQVSACIAKPAKMAEIIKQLDSTNQVAFLSVVNEAISAMPGSSESKAATFLNVNRAAVSAASDKTAMIAEVFATVQPEALTVINERFASDLLNIKADPSRTYTEAQFTKTALNIMDKVNTRNETAEDSAVRSTFAILMLINASNNSFPSLTETLVKTLPESSQEAAGSEWIPAALGVNQEKSYDPLLGAASNAGRIPSTDVTIRLAGSQLLEALLPSLVECGPFVATGSDGLEHAIGPRESELEPQPQADPRKEPENWDKEPGGYQGQLI